MAALPDPVAGLTFRASTRADAEAVHALTVACYAVDQPQERETLDDVVEQYDLSWWDPATDSVVGVDGSGRVLATALVARRPGQVRTRQATLVGTVHPDVRGRGVGRALLAWQVQRGEDLVRRADATTDGPEDGAADGADGAGPGAGHDVPWMLRAWVEDHHGDRERLLRAAGFTPRRFTATMRRDLADPLPEVTLPDGVEVVGLAVPGTAGPAGRELSPLQDRVRRTHNEAFADHWGSEPIEAEDWARHCVSGPGARPDLSFAALDGSGEVVAYLVSGTYPQDWQAQGFTEGWTNLLGVAPSHRRQGLARTLLVRAMGTYAAEGLQHAGLAVDVENPRALELYTGLGYVERGRETSWVRDVDRGGAPVGQPPR